MATNRPFARLGIADLEEIFNEQCGDLTSLSNLNHELSFRQVPRALALQERIRKAELHLAKSTISNLNEVPSTSIIGTSKSPQTKNGQLNLLSQTPKDTDARSEVALPTSKLSTPSEAQPLPQIAIDDAYKILKVSVEEVWEKIEMTRRSVVQKSSPIATKGIPEVQIIKRLSEARLANDAAIVIAARRCGRQ